MVESSASFGRTMKDKARTWNRAAILRLNHLTNDFTKIIPAKSFQPSADRFERFRSSMIVQWLNFKCSSRSVCQTMSQRSASLKRGISPDCQLPRASTSSSIRKHSSRWTDDTRISDPQQPIRRAFSETCSRMIATSGLCYSLCNLQTQR